MPTSRRLIIHADDLGLSPAVSRGILKAMEEGVVTSTSLLANYPEGPAALQEALRAGREVGWHLNLVQGPPAADPQAVPQLLGKEGRFKPLGSLFWAGFWKKLEPRQVRTELEAQYRVFARAGVHPTHVDGHRHCHLLPVIREVTREFLREKAIPFVRAPREAFGGPGPRPLARALLASMRASRKEFWELRGLTTLPFFGLALSGRPGDPALWRRALLANPHAVSELMVHPGFFNSQESELLGQMGEGREKELQWLTSPDCRKLLRDLNYQLIRYGDLIEME